MSDINRSRSGTDLDAVRHRLHHARGMQFWRSLDDLADTPAFHELLEREFPRGAAELHDPISRRTFLKLMGASLALAGLSGCTTAMRQPQEKVAPFAHLAVEQTPGIPLYYATALTLDGFGMGVAVRNYDGRPIKVEGNPQHPASLGATDIYAQAELLALYDPDRPESVMQRGAISTWPSFLAALNQIMQAQKGLSGQGVRILSGTLTSPTIASQREELRTLFPAATWVQYDPVGRSNTYAGTRLAFGEALEPRYRFDQAAMVVALDADFLSEGPGRVRYARDAMAQRRVRLAQSEMSRMYVVEPHFSTTGMIADHRLPLKASQVAAVAAALAHGLGVAGVAAPNDLPEAAQHFVAAVLDDLRQAGSRALVLAGEAQPPSVHALAHTLNVQLGAVGTTVEYTDPVVVQPSDQMADLAQLVADLNAGQVDLLVVLDANPVFSAPADLDFGTAMRQARVSVVQNAYRDETGQQADWFIPLAHPLESWGDVRAFDGSATIIQPLIMPLYAGRSAVQLLAALLGQAAEDDYALVAAAWQQRTELDDAAFADFFKQSLNDGVVAESAFPPRAVTLAALNLDLPPVIAGYELTFRASPTIYDGRFANNGWLQELPSPITKITWDNAALISVKTAITLFGLDADPKLKLDRLNAASEIDRQHALERLIAVNGSLVELVVDGRSLSMPVWIVPGHADETITVHLGYGRTAGGQVLADTGFDVYRLRNSQAPWFTSVQVRPVPGRYELASTQDHWTLEGRDIVRVGTLAHFREDPKGIATEIYQEEYGQETPPYESMLPPIDYSTGNQWAMAIDLNTCIGCNACIIACQAENNIPVIGKAEVARGREMHWIRIDRYFAGLDYDNPAIYVMPMTCQHCERAPCELVCPVVATVHDAEGINNMIYNRCVGTKYCSNNCPFKVRRFNFFQYNDLNTATLKLMRNPEVTVRNRGVMEKCSFCIQRISQTRIRAQVEGNRPIGPSEILTACQQVCPTQAIAFGDKNNPQSDVAQCKQEPHNYTVLDELNVLPRVSYLARLRNPSAGLEEHG